MDYYFTYYKDDDMAPQLEGCIDAFTDLFDFLPYDIDCWVAGGAIRSYFENKTPRDIDIFCATNDDQIAARNALRKEFKFVLNSDYSVRFDVEGLTVELVNKSFDTAEDTLKYFDYIIAQAAVGRDYICYHQQYFVDLATKTLTISNLSADTAWLSLSRLQKYIQYGYTAPESELLKIAAHIQQIDHIELYDDILELQTNNAPAIFNNLFDTLVSKRAIVPPAPTYHYNWGSS